MATILPSPHEIKSAYKSATANVPSMPSLAQANNDAEKVKILTLSLETMTEKIHEKDEALAGLAKLHARLLDKVTDHSLLGFFVERASFVLAGTLAAFAALGSPAAHATLAFWIAVACALYFSVDKASPYAAFGTLLLHGTTFMASVALALGYAADVAFGAPMGDTSAILLACAPGTLVLLDLIFSWAALRRVYAGRGCVTALWFLFSVYGALFAASELGVDIAPYAPPQMVADIFSTLLAKVPLPATPTVDVAYYLATVGDAQFLGLFLLCGLLRALPSDAPAPAAAAELV